MRMGKQTTTAQKNNISGSLFYFFVGVIRVLFLFFELCE